MQHPIDSGEYHRALVSDKRRIGRGILAIALLIGGMAVFALVLTSAAAFLEYVLAVETRPGFTPLVLVAGMVSVGLLIPWSMLIQRWLFGVPAASLSSVFSRFRFDVFGRALVLLLPATVLIQIVQYWVPFAQTTWAWHETLLLLGSAFVLVPLQAAGEEYGFRGLILRVVGSWTHSARLGLVLGIIVSSLLFAAVHASTSGLLNLWYVVFGVGFGYITWRTGGVEIAVVFHAVYNVSAFVFDAALAVDPTVVADRTAAAIDVSALLPAVVVAGAVAVVAVRSRRTGTVVAPQGRPVAS